jgi:hypothetical protein
MEIVLHVVAEHGRPDYTGQNGEHVEHIIVAFNQHGIFPVEPNGVCMLIRKRFNRLCILRGKML